MAGLAALRSWWRRCITVRLITAVFGLALVTAAALGYLRYRDEEQKLDRLIEQMAAAGCTLQAFTVKHDDGDA